MWYRFKEGNPKGICRVKHFQIAWYDMEQNGDFIQKIMGERKWKN